MSVSCSRAPFFSPHNLFTSMQVADLLNNCKWFSLISVNPRWILFKTQDNSLVLWWSSPWLPLSPLLLSAREDQKTWFKPTGNCPIKNKLGTPDSCICFARLSFRCHTRLPIVDTLFRHFICFSFAPTCSREVTKMVHNSSPQQEPTGKQLCWSGSFWVLPKLYLL